MNILITGGTGLIGRALIRALQEKEHKLSIVSRHVDRAKQLLGPEVTYYGSTEEVSNFESLDAVINLAG
jgi:NAD dependent epimerase/dehydratase family enzyme